MGIFAFKGFTAMKEKLETDPGKIEGTDLRILKYPDPLVRTKHLFFYFFDPSSCYLIRSLFTMFS